MLNLCLLQVSTDAVLSEQNSTRVELLPMVASQVLWRTCDNAPKHIAGQGGVLWYWVAKEQSLIESKGLLPQRNHTYKAIQTFAPIGLLTDSWPPYNTTIPYVNYAFVWHPYFLYISRRLRPYIKLKEVMKGFPYIKVACSWAISLFW